jgi:hypothetical protein
MEYADKNISEWEEKFNNYLESESKCISNIEQITEIKTNFNKLLGNQRKDDVLFYKSILDNSLFYLNSSLKIKKIKFLKDLNYIWDKIDARKKMDEVTTTNFDFLLKDYRKLSEDILLLKRSNNRLGWVKDERIQDLQELEIEITEILNYHIKLIEFFYSSTEIERAFYCCK